MSALTDCRLRLLRKRLSRAPRRGGPRCLQAVAEVLARRVLRLNDTILELSEHALAAAPMEDLARLRQKLFSEWSF